MNYRLGILVATTVCLLSAQVAQAGSTIESQIVKGPGLSFLLPIDQSIQASPAQTGIAEPAKIAPAAGAAPDIVPSPDSPAIIDNDERQTAPKTESFLKQSTDAQGKSCIEAGARFPVSLSCQINSKTAKVGDPVQARLDDDIKIDDRLIAKRGDLVTGHVRTVEPARRMLKSEFALKHRWMRANGALGIQFDEIVTSQGEHLPLLALPATQPRIIKNKDEGRILGVNQNGEVTAPLSMQLKSQAIHMAIRAGASAGGVFSLGAVPVAFGVLGAMSPSFVYMHPVGKDVRHRRLKGFALGFTSGLPGGFLLADYIIRGQEASIKPGDIFLAEFKQSFNGEQTMEAELVPGVSTKVHGQIIPEDKKQ